MKHSLHYNYDAAGNKLKQLTLENPVTANGNKPLQLPPITSMALCPWVVNSCT